MIITPRYGGPAILTMDGDGNDGLAPIIRQHRRFAAMLAGFDDAAWSTPSRCDGWSTRDVAAHLVSVNGFWKASIVAGLAGQPSTFLKGFDPAKTPPAIVNTMAGLSNGEILKQFQSATDDDVGRDAHKHGGPACTSLLSEQRGARAKNVLPPTR